MNVLLIVIALAVGGGVLAYLRAPLSVATTATGVGLLVLTQMAQGFLSGLVLLLAWIGWVGMLLLNSATLRRRHVTGPLLALLRKALPSMSQTERDAIDAGTVWWDAELFSGAPAWRRLLDLPAATVSAEEQAFLDGPVEILCRMADEWTLAREHGDLPPALWDYIKQQGLLGIIIPRRYGGLEFSACAHSAIMLKLASRSGTTAVSCMVPNSLGPAELLLRYGTEAQKAHYLPRLARGQEIPCFALTNPYAGSDAANIPDFGIVCMGDFEGQRVLGMRVTWEKRYITLAPIATLLGLAFQLYDPDGLLGDTPEIGITLALVPTSHAGVEIGRRHYPARQAFQNGPTSGRDVFIPMSWVIGGQERCGQGWRMLMNCLAAGRAISLPASSTAALKVCAYTSGTYASLRRQFRLPLAGFEGVQEALARIAAQTYVVDAARSVTAAVLDRGEEPAVLSAVLKYQSTERMRVAINAAMDIHGGRALCDGPANYLFHPYMAAPVAITVEGANILTRSLIIFGQGALRCHPWLLKEIDAATEPRPEAALRQFDQAFCGHVSHVLANFARAAFSNATGGVVGSDPSVGEANYWYAQIERASASFALVADSALAQLGGQLKRREMLSGRFADILGELYLLSCALKVFEDGGRRDSELAVLEYAMRDGLYRVQQALDGILQNLPQRGAAWVLRRIVFPWGLRMKPPADVLTSRVAMELANDGPLRARLSDGIFLAADADDVLGCLSHAAELVAAADGLTQRVEEARQAGRIPAWHADLPSAALAAGVIDEQEVAQLRALDVAVRRAFDVDDFAPAELYRAASVKPRRANAA